MDPQIFDCKFPDCPGKVKFKGPDRIILITLQLSETEELREVDAYLECDGPGRHTFPYTVKVPVRRSS